MRRIPLLTPASGRRADPLLRLAALSLIGLSLLSVAAIPLLVLCLVLMARRAASIPDPALRRLLVRSYLAFAAVVIAASVAILMVVSVTIRNHDGTLQILEDYRSADLERIASDFDAIRLIAGISPDMMETSGDVGFFQGVTRARNRAWDVPFPLMPPLHFMFSLSDRVTRSEIVKVLRKRGVEDYNPDALTAVNTMIRADLLFVLRLRVPAGTENYGVTCIRNRAGAFDTINVGRGGAIDMTVVGRGAEAAGLCAAFADRAVASPS